MPDGGLARIARPSAGTAALASVDCASEYDLCRRVKSTALYLLFRLHDVYVTPRAESHRLDSHLVLRQLRRLLGAACIDVIPFLRKAAALGYRAVEIGGKRPHLAPLDYRDRAKLDAVHEEAARLKLEIASIAGYTDFTAGRDRRYSAGRNADRVR